MKFCTITSTVVLSAMAGVAAPSFAQCTTNFALQSDQSFPKLQGRLVYHTYAQYGDGSSNLFLYDFQRGGSPVQLSHPGWNIGDPMNAHFSPDGKRIAFMGKVHGHWHIFVWAIGAATPPTNLTLAMGATRRNEDPKWSADGKKIVFKQDSDIKILNLSYSGNGSVGVANVATVSNDGWANEDSMPYFSQGGKYVVFARGAAGTSDIYRIQVDPVTGSPVGQPAPFAATSDVSDYYPVARDYSTYFFTRWDNASSRTDQIYMKIPNSSNTPVALKLNNCYANNSDAAPVDEDFLMFSGTSRTPYFNLYMGNIETGQVWSLDKQGVNTGNKQKLGASYTNAR
jgi:Tol biopolymer transport system component